MIYKHSKKWYRPMEIAKLGLIKNSTGGDNVNSNYVYILKLIKTGRVRAKNYSAGKTDMVYWLVPEDEIERYHQTVTKLA